MAFGRVSDLLCWVMSGLRLPTKSEPIKTLAYSAGSDSIPACMVTVGEALMAMRPTPLTGKRIIWSKPAGWAGRAERVSTVRQAGQDCP